MMFGWQRSDVRGYSPVIVWDKLHGSTKNFEIVGLRELKPHEKTLTLAELAALYPAPSNQE